MEQYQIPIEIYFQTINSILKKYKPVRIFVRRVGSEGGKTAINQKLRRSSNFEIKKTKKRLDFYLNGRKIFFSELIDNEYTTGRNWSVAYERFYPDGILHITSTGYPHPQEPQISGPDDPKLPEVKRSILGAVITQEQKDFLIEITFETKIKLRQVFTKKKQSRAFFHYWTAA